MLRRTLLLGSILAFAAGGCRGGDTGIAQGNRVFYAYETVGADLGTEFERAYPPLDLQAGQGRPQYKGVEVLNGKLRISRPVDWVIRSASNRPGSRFVQYLSPREYVVGVYERQELSNALWSDVIARYEKSLQDNKAEIVHQGVPIATWNGQGREYLVRRRVPGAKGSYLNISREFLVRGEHRILLVQIVHPPSGIELVTGELERVMTTLELR